MPDNKRTSDTTLLNRFKKSFLLHSSRYNLYSDETIEKGSTSRHNKAVTDLGKLEDKVIENPSLYSDLILEFLEGDDPKASLCAGFTCLWANIHTEKAIENYERALELAPNHAPALSNLANIYFEQSRFEEAIASAEKALEAEPSFYQASTLLAIIHSINGDEENAKKYFHMAI
jgi:tetratricopeptide (TPR) repeat protein